MELFPYLIAAFVFAAGLWGIVHQRTTIGQVVSLAIMQSATYLILIDIGFRYGGAAPILISTQPNRTSTVDPIVQALVLTDVVCSATTTALLLVFIMHMVENGGSLDPVRPTPVEDEA